MLSVSPLSKAEVAHLYHTGLSLLASGNIADAVEKLISAARAGHADAAFQLAKYCSKHGQVENAFHWAIMAANGRHAEAQNMVATMYMDGQGVPVSRADAMNWHRSASALGNAESEKFLAARRSSH